MSNLKRRHHHVWGHYLKQWSTNNRDIYYTTQTGKIALDSVKGLARELDFYKVHLPNQEDIKFVTGFSNTAHIDLREMHASFYGDFVRASFINELATKRGAPPEVMETINELEFNALENLHTKFELDARPIYNALCTGDTSLLKGKANQATFMSYLGHQIARSKAFKEKCLEPLNDSSRYPENAPYTFEENSRLIDRNWWFLSFMFGINIGANFFMERNNRSHVFIDNNTDEPFITTDNPIANIHDSLSTLDKYTPPEQADFFYPLNPRYAYMINDSNKYSKGEISISKEVARKLNLQIASKSVNHIFSNSEEQLREIKKELKTQIK